MYSIGYSRGICHYQALHAFTAEGRHPTVQELAKRTAVSEKTIHRHVDALASEGVVAIRDVPTVRTRKEIVLLEQRDARKSPMVPAGEEVSP